MPLYDGFWQDPRNGAVNLTCVPGTACVKKYDDDAVAEMRAAEVSTIERHSTPPRRGSRVFSMAADHYRYASFCDKCDALPGVRIFFIILLYSVALYVIFELATHPAIPALTILLTFGQITPQMQYFEIPWPKALARWMQVASLTFADLQILGLDCVARWDYFRIRGDDVRTLPLGAAHRRPYFDVRDCASSVSGRPATTVDRTSTEADAIRRRRQKVVRSAPRNATDYPLIAWI